MIIRVPGAGKASATGTGTPGVTSRLVLLHRCSVATCVIKQGTEDSRTDTSSIIGQGQIVLGAFTQGDQVWADTVKCVQETFAPFNITITDQDPGTALHFENMVGGKSSDLGRSDLANA